MKEQLTEEDQEGFKKSLAKTLEAPGVKIKCPSCRQNVTLDESKLKFHNRGREAVCPECKKVIILSRYVRRPQ